MAGAGNTDPDVRRNGEQHGGDSSGASRQSSIRVLARSQYLRDLPELKSAGADTVFAGEGEVALAFVEDLLVRLGATAEQIDRERARAHDELFSESTG